MIILIARRLDERGTRFEFKIYPPDGEPVTASEKGAVTGELKKLGVTTAERLVDHACEWGVVEIPEH
jgi:hypothetical protein